MIVNKLLSACFMVCFLLSISVNADENGFCMRTVMVQKPVRKQRIVTKKKWYNWNKKTVTEYYYEDEFVPETVKECCEGFVKNGPYCDPHCDDICQNGKCIGNNECSCFNGFIKTTSHNCIPECTNCENGKCFAPEICSCNRGYMKADDGSCVPKCDPPCINADCISPNKCRCLEKHRFINDTACASLAFLQKHNACVEKCINGECNDSHSCICNSGYEMNLIGVCTKKCPIKCYNGICLDDQCVCNDNFVKYNSTNCVKKEFMIKRDICNTICRNGKCSDSNECLCNDGFKFNKEQKQCEPVCSFEDSEDCINGKCIAPNECECLQDYVSVSNFQCDPICENCTNGFCQEPNVCECYEGHTINALGICEPKCDPECKNAQCVAPQKCKCYENYEKLTSNECVAHQFIIERVDCLESCTNGHCDELNRCVCNETFDKNMGKCLKVCNKDCINGKCFDDQCYCNEGYRQTNATTNECEPICAFEDDHDCINGKCVAPNVCECFVGFKMLENSNCTCVTKCDPLCVNGICVGENSCQCHEGYFPVSNFECSPRCENCTNGYCMAPEMCDCNEGFVWSEFDCVIDKSEMDYENDYDLEICNKSCVNGKCFNNTCICTDDLVIFHEIYCVTLEYIDDYNRNLDLNVCEDFCPDGSCAINGDCSDDSEMSNEHFKINETTTSQSDFHCECINGNCNDDNQCYCFEGFSLSIENNITCFENVESKLNNTVLISAENKSNISSLKVIIFCGLITILVLSIMIILVMCLTAKYTTKNYIVQEKEMSKNCVYFAKTKNDLDSMDYEL